MRTTTGAAITSVLTQEALTTVSAMAAIDWGLMGGAVSLGQVAIYTYTLSGKSVHTNRILCHLCHKWLKTQGHNVTALI